MLYDKVVATFRWREQGTSSVYAVPPRVAQGLWVRPRTRTQEQQTRVYRFSNDVRHRVPFPPPFSWSCVGYSRENSGNWKAAFRGHSPKPCLLLYLILVHERTYCKCNIKKKTKKNVPAARDCFCALFGVMTLLYCIYICPDGKPEVSFFHFVAFVGGAGGGGGGGGGGNQHRGAPGGAPMQGGGGPRGSGNQNARVYVGNLAWDVAWQVR